MRINVQRRLCRLVIDEHFVSLFSFMPSYNVRFLSSCFHIRQFLFLSASHKNIKEKEMYLREFKSFSSFF